MFSPRSIYVFFRSSRASACVLGISLFLAGCATVGPHTPPAQAALSLSTTSFNFNTVVIGQTATQTLKITNTGTAPLTIDSLSLKSPQFQFTGPSLPRTILASQSLAYTVSFIPTTAGSTSAALQITSNASAVPTSVSLAGVAEKAIAALQISPASINFGNLKLQTTGTQNVTLKNTGDINLTVSGITVAGSGFGFSNLSPGLSVPPNQTVTFQVWFRPQTAGSASGTVSILSGSMSSPANIPVSGDGVSSTPPPPPPLQHKVALSWHASTSVVTGYRVYRSSISGSGYSPLTAVLPELTYSDATVHDGSTYYYVVTAVDALGDESPHSNEVAAAIPAS